jgi:signal transduction histidine kinase
MFSYAGLVIPAIVIIYGSLLESGVVRAPHPIDGFGYLAFSLWWLYLGILQYLCPSSSRLDSFLRLLAYHLLAAAYLIFVIGVATPVISCWLILTLASYAYFNLRGFFFNILSLAIIAGIDIWIWRDYDHSLVTANLLTFAAVATTALIVLSVSRHQEISKKELENIKAYELLQRDRVSAIVNNLTDAVISTDTNGIIKVYNASSMNLLDTNSDLKGNHIDDILPLFDQEHKEISIFKELQAAKTVVKRDDLSFVFGKDDCMRLEITYTPIRSNYSRSKQAETRDGYAIIMRDITKQKSLEEERDEFISVISHELRTPITIAEGTISNVQVMMEHPDATKSMLKDAINVAHEQVMFLASMVNDLSTLSRAERGVSKEAEIIDVRELAHKLHDKYSESAKKKKIHLNLDLGVRVGKVSASRLYLEEILQNLITNAIKYTKKGSVAIIIKQSKDEVLFSVKDTGIGISKSDQAKIFDKFYRSEDYRTRESSGTGLGLYVAAKLAHKIGTKIELKSRLNFGSTFSIKLPEAKDK